jgi:hypothetical protein
VHNRARVEIGMDRVVGLAILLHEITCTNNAGPTQKVHSLRTQS